MEGRFEVDYDFTRLRGKHGQLDEHFDAALKRYDFSTHEAICAMTKAIMAEYYMLDLAISETNLCPRIGNRVAYLKFVSDLLRRYDAEDTTLVDIGTGYCCIYLLLAARLTNWKRLIGTDINTESLEKARQHVELNGLGDKIELFTADRDAGVKFSQCDALSGTAISICNPPFYADSEEMQRLQALKPVAKGSELNAAENELITKGGELAFITSMVEASFDRRAEYQWFTSLIGKSDTARKVTATFRAKKINNFFVMRLDLPGITKRWVCGWSFKPTRIESPNQLYSDSVVPFRCESLIDIAAKLDVLGLKYTLQGDSDFIEVVVKTDNWSRRYRRTGKSPIPYDAVGIRVKIHRHYILWVYGLNRILFESFINYIKKTI